MHEYYVYIAAALGAVVLIGLVLIMARSRSRARPAPAAGPDALAVADALDAEAALNVADALDVVDAVVEAHAYDHGHAQWPARAVASRALPARAASVRALPAPVAAAPAAAAEVIEAEIVEEGPEIAWPGEDAAESEESQPWDAAGTSTANPDPAAGGPAHVPVVGVRPDDPNVLAAATEARRRFDEFQSAFAARKRGQTFAVKVPFSHPGGREFMWVAVRSIADGVVSGRLASEPVEVRQFRRGEPVTAAVASVTDWLLREADASAPARGAFTAEAVRAAALGP